MMNVSNIRRLFISFTLAIVSIPSLAATPFDAICGDLIRRGFFVEESYRATKQFDPANRLDEFAVKDEFGNWDNALCGPTSLFNSLPKLIAKASLDPPQKAALLAMDLRSFVYQRILKPSGPRKRERLKADGLEPENMIEIVQDLLGRKAATYLPAVGAAVTAKDYLATYDPHSDHVVIGHIAFHSRQHDGTYKRLYGHYNLLAGRRRDQFLLVETYQSNRYGPYQFFRLTRDNPVSSDRPALLIEPRPIDADVVTLEGLLIID